jgi:carbonic anhydrase/acetyltransferase-like protein (isoleucine patch superfamily)
MPIYNLNGDTPTIPENDAWVAPDAMLIGKVRLDRGTSVWFGAVLRGDNELIHVGDGSNVQDHSVLHTDPGFPLVIGQSCTIGHRAMLHGCIIGDFSLIGIGATILNGACIGRNCIIGAHALVTDNKEIPDHSVVVGAPGRVVRQIHEAEIEARKQQALRYENNWRRYAQGLTLVR